jgi:hypothetical protein
MHAAILLALAGTECEAACQINSAFEFVGVLFGDGRGKKVNDGGGRQSIRGGIVAGNSRMGY